MSTPLSSASTKTLHELIAAVDMLKHQMSELQALREAVAKVEPSASIGSTTAAAAN